jgi:hypothetical protein
MEGTVIESASMTATTVMMTFLVLLWFFLSKAIVHGPFSKISHGPGMPIARPSPPSAVSVRFALG